MTCCLNLISYRNDFLVDLDSGSNPNPTEMIENYSLNNLINYYKFFPEIKCINFYFTTSNNYKGNKIEMLKKVNIFLKEKLKISTMPDINFFLKTPNSYNNILNELTLISKKYNFSIFIDLNSTLSGNKVDLNSLTNNTYYIQHKINDILINKLFILKQNFNYEDLEYYNYKNLNSSFGRLNNIKSETNLINDDRTFLKKNLLKNNNLIHYLFNLLYRKKYINIFDILNNRLNKNYKQIQNILKKYDNWLFNYFNALSYFHNGNYKNSIEHINNCIKIKKYKIEPYLLLSKIHYFNKNFQNTVDCLNRFKFHNIFNYFEFNDLEISNFSFKFQYALAYKQLNKNLEAVQVCNKLLKNTTNELHLRIILLYLQNLIEDLDCSSKYSNYKHSKNNKYNVNNIELNYSENNQYSFLPDHSSKGIFYINYNIDNNCILIQNDTCDNDDNTEEKYNFWENIEMKNDNETKNDNIKKQNLEIKLENKINDFSFFQKNKQIYIISNLSPLIISHLQYENTEKQCIKQLNKFQTDWNELEMVTKFINVKNLYIGIARYKKNHKIYKLLYLNYENFKPIDSSKIFKINDFKIQDLITRNDNIYLLGNSKNEIFIYNYTINDFYFKFNIPINYKKNIFINVKNEIKLDININNYQIKNYQNYIISNDSPKFSINYDIENKLLEYNNNYYELDSFIYLPKHIKTIVEKSKDVFFYNKTDSLELYDRINESEYLIGDNINDCKYLIIEYEDLEKLSYINLSTIIENQTIIIALIPINYINNENLDNSILQNEFLSKLFLLNIAKKDDYIDFIIDNILDENQYDKRYNFMNIDLENIYNNCNIITYSIKRIDKINQKFDNFNNNLKNHKYKQYLLKNLINELNNQSHGASSPTALVSIYIIKLILFHDQNFNIYYEKGMQLNKKEEFLLSINILKKPQILQNIENINESSLILIKNMEKYLEYRKHLDEGCIIYLQTEQKLIFI